MKNEKYILDEAVDSLFKYTKIQAIVKNTGLRSDILIEIARENNLPVLLVTGVIFQLLVRALHC